MRKPRVERCLGRGSGASGCCQKRGLATASDDYGTVEAGLRELGPGLGNIAIDIKMRPSGIVVLLVHASICQVRRAARFLSVEAEVGVNSGHSPTQHREGDKQRERCAKSCVHGRQDSM